MPQALKSPSHTQVVRIPISHFQSPTLKHRIIFLRPASSGASSERYPLSDRSENKTLNRMMVFYGKWKHENGESVKSRSWTKVKIVNKLGSAKKGDRKSRRTRATPIEGKPPTLAIFYSILSQIVKFHSDRFRYSPLRVLLLIHTDCHVASAYCICQLAKSKRSVSTVAFYRIDPLSLSVCLSLAKTAFIFLNCFLFRPFRQVFGQHALLESGGYHLVTQPVTTFLSCLGGYHDASKVD